MDMPQLPAYSAEKFLNREDLINPIKEMAVKILGGKRKPEDPNVITLRGERATGKTWLALHLVRTVLPQIPGVEPLLISLVPTLEPGYIPQGTIVRKNERFFDKESSKDPDEFCVETIKWVAGVLDTTTAEKASASELSHWLVRDIKQKHSQKLIALILDSVFETNWDYLKKLEEYLLVPLAALPNSLIVMTGRGNSYPWVSPYLRITDEQRLGVLADEYLEKIIKEKTAQTGLTLEMVKEISGGNPGIAYLIAQSKDLDEIKSNLNYIANLLLDITSMKNDSKIREYFEALCVLDGFDEDEIGYMFSKYYDNIDYEIWTDDQKRTIKKKMLETNLIRWENGKYLMDTSARRVLEKYLEFQNRDKWARLHQGAKDLYENWAKHFSKHANFFNAKAKRHNDILEKAGYLQKNVPLQKSPHPKTKKQIEKTV